MVEQRRLAEHTHGRIGRIGKGGRRQRLLGDGVEPAQQLGGLVPGALGVPRQGVKAGNVVVLAQALIEKILLVELVHHREVALEPRVLAVLLQPTQTNRVERPQVHLIEIEGDVFLIQPVGDARRQFLRRLVGEGDHQQVFRRHAFVLDQVDNALDEREGLAGAGASDDQERAIGGGDGLYLRWIRS